MFFAFFAFVLYKRTRHSLGSFTIFINERESTLHSFWLHKSYKNYKSHIKKNVKERIILFIRLKKNLTFFFQYISIYIYIYIYLYKSIYIYIYIYIYLYIFIYLQYIHIYTEKKNKGSFAFFCKRTLRSLHSFTFFAKECCVLCVLLRSLQKNVVFFAFFCVLLRS